MLLLTLATLGLAADDGVQLRVLPGAIDFAESYAEALDPSYDYEDLSAPYDCYDLVGIRDFNLDVPIDSVDLTLDDDELTVTIDFGLIRGTDMVVYGTDADWLDLCAEFEVDLRYAQITDGRVVAALELDTGFGGFFGSPVLDFRWADAPLVEGTIETDFAYVPDSLILPFVEAAIRQAAADALTDTLPPLLEDFLGETSYAGDYGGLATSVELSRVEITPAALSMAVDLQLSPSSTAACEIGNPGVGPLQSGLRSPILAIDEPQGADLGVGITEAMIGEALHSAWRAGWFCFKSDTVDSLVAGMAFWVDPAVLDLEGWATLDSPPQIHATAAGIEVSIPDIRVEVTGKVNGDRVPIVVANLDLTATAIPGFDQSLTSMTLSLVDPKFDFTRVDLRHIPSPGTVKKHIERDVEAWASDWARDAMSNVVLFDALYYAWGVALLLDRTEPRDGGLEIYFELYDENDPAVDKVAPNASIDVVEQHKRSVHLEASATDDRTEPLALSWQVNGNGWSDWTTEPALDLADLPDGSYTIELVARDVWLNVDPSPAIANITVKAPTGDDSGCGCSQSPAAAPWQLLPLLLLFRRR